MERLCTCKSSMRAAADDAIARRKAEEAEAQHSRSLLGIYPPRTPRVSQANRMAAMREEERRLDSGPISSTARTSPPGWIDARRTAPFRPCGSNSPPASCVLSLSDSSARMGRLASPPVSRKQVQADRPHRRIPKSTPLSDAYGALVALLGSKRGRELQAAFRRLDEGNGVVTPREFARVLSSEMRPPLGLAEEHVAVLLEACGMDAEGLVPYRSMLLELQERKILVLRKKLRAAAGGRFNSGSGVDGQGHYDWTKLFRSYDKARLGALKWEVFQQMIRQEVKVSEKTMSASELREVFSHQVHADAGLVALGLSRFVELMTGTVSSAEEGVPVMVAVKIESVKTERSRVER